MILVRIIFTLLISTFICTTSFSQKDKNQKDKNFSQKGKKADPDEKHFDAMMPGTKPNSGKAIDAVKPAESDFNWKEIYYGCLQLESYERLACLMKKCPKCFDLVWIKNPDPRDPIVSNKPDPRDPVSSYDKLYPSHHPIDIDDIPDDIAPYVSPHSPIGKITVEIYR